MDEKVSGYFSICSPEEEYEMYVNKQIDMAIRFDEKEKIELYHEALEVGLELLKDLK